MTLSHIFRLECLCGTDSFGETEISLSVRSNRRRLLVTLWLHRSPGKKIWPIPPGNVSRSKIRKWNAQDLVSIPRVRGRKWDTWESMLRAKMASNPTLLGTRWTCRSVRIGFGSGSEKLGEKRLYVCPALTAGPLIFEMVGERPTGYSINLKHSKDASLTGANAT